MEAAPVRPLATALAIHRLRAGVALARAQPAAARAAFDAGIAEGRTVVRPAQRALLAMDYARLLRTGGNRREAHIRLLRTAHQILSQLGAKPFLDACGTELSACGVPIRHTSSSNPPNMTAKEQVVARLVARGLSNREAAAEL